MAGVLVMGARLAGADPLLCDVVTPAECQISTVHSLGAGGTFEVDRTLHILPTGELRVDPGGALVLDIAGDLNMNAGGKITGNASTANGHAASISITTAGAMLLRGQGAGGAAISADQIAGSCSGGLGGTIELTSNYEASGPAITLKSGARISVNARCSAGEIRITATKAGVDIRGVVESVSGLTGTGAKQPPGGGPISIIASCDLVIDDTGRVTSQGRDPGADLVHLEAGGNVVVLGLVESTGAGHAIPNFPANHCSGLARPDKPSNTTACVEVWAGKAVVIDGAGTNHGEINADLSQGGSGKLSWIDVFARNNIAINGVGGGPYLGDAKPYAVHANQLVNNAKGGMINVKSVEGAVALGGQAIQADSSTRGGAGGLVVVEAGGSAVSGGDVQVGSASVRARGSNKGGGPQAGGDIAIRSFKAHVVGVAPGELNADGGGGKATPEPGAVTLTGCDAVPPAVSYAGAATPSAVTAPPACGGQPSLPAYVVFPASACDVAPCQAPDCPPPPCEGPDCPCEGDNCPPPPCEGPDCPCEGDNCPPPPCEGPQCEPYKYFCEKGTVKDVLNPVTGRFPGNVGPDVLVDVRTQSLQAAIDTVSDTNGDGYIIIGVVAQSDGLPGGVGDQEVEVTRAYDKPFAMIACGVTLKDPLPCDGIPIVKVHASATSPEHPVGSGVTLYFQEITAFNSNSASGWVVNGDGRLLEAIGAQKNMFQGVKIVGSHNTIRNSIVTDNVGGGLLVQGDGNKVAAVSAMGNYGGGIIVSGYGNTVKNSTAGAPGAGNQSGGIIVNGGSNLINGNGAFANGGNGITVAGGTAASPNVVKNNVAGGPGRGNQVSGIAISGAGQGQSGVIDVLANTTQANVYAGLRITGTGHRLKDNASGGASAEDNVTCQYRVDAGNLNATGNKRSGVLIPGADGTPFPQGCF